MVEKPTKLPFWTVLKGTDPARGFCAGHTDKAAALKDAEARNTRAAELGLDVSYAAVDRPSNYTEPVEG